jgi:mannose/fructose/N-acetylgalactosamine-specific phosphotransferase system component IIC
MLQPDAKDYALSRAELLTEGFKGLLLVNGGGAAALLAFIAQIVDKSPRLAELSLHGVAFMAVGLSFAMLVPFLRYHHSHWAQKREKSGRTKNMKSLFWLAYIVSQYLSVAVFLLALIYLVTNASPIVAQIPIKKC